MTAPNACAINAIVGSTALEIGTLSRWNRCRRCHHLSQIPAPTNALSRAMTLWTTIAMLLLRLPPPSNQREMISGPIEDGQITTTSTFKMCQFRMTLHRTRSQLFRRLRRAPLLKRFVGMIKLSINPLRHLPPGRAILAFVVTPNQTQGSAKTSINSTTPPSRFHQWFRVSLGRN